MPQRQYRLVPLVVPLLCFSADFISLSCLGCRRHFSGVYSIKASAFRFLRTGNATSMPGQEGIPAVYSPMTRTLEDLETFWRAIMSMKPWEYDHSVSRVSSTWDRGRYN